MSSRMASALHEQPLPPSLAGIDNRYLSHIGIGESMITRLMGYNCVMGLFKRKLSFLWLIYIQIKGSL